MRKRRVILLVELESNEAINDLKHALRVGLTCRVRDYETKVLQIQSNVVQKRTNPKSRGKR